MCCNPLCVCVCVCVCMRAFKKFGKTYTNITGAIIRMAGNFWFSKIYFMYFLRFMGRVCFSLRMNIKSIEEFSLN